LAVVRRCDKARHHRRRLGARDAGRRDHRRLRGTLRHFRRRERYAARGDRLQPAARTQARRLMAGKVVIHTDGACSGNPGPGGWGAVLQYGSTVKELKGGEPLTTNNRMELTAAISALNALTRKCEVELHTDSVYVKDGLTKWIFGWKKNGWRTADKKPVKNVELWQAL